MFVSSMKLNIEEANEYVYYYSDDIISDEVAIKMLINGHTASVLFSQIIPGDTHNTFV